MRLRNKQSRKIFGIPQNRASLSEGSSALCKGGDIPVHSGVDIANKNYKPQTRRGRDARVPTVHSGG